MSDYDPSELLIVCESIIEDGELTYDELYRLADWLNNHREACLHWPGNLLVEPLQKAWADGKITRTEARQVARLILKICKEAAKRESEEAFAQVAELASQAARSFDLTRPQLPAIPFSTRIKSHTAMGVFYEVDLGGPTCNCPDFRSFRRKLPVGHLTRCCKHIFGAYAQLDPSDRWPGWLGAFLRLAWTPHPHHEWLVLHVRPAWYALHVRKALVLISSAPNGWANVFAANNDRYDRYGYNVIEDRWSYNIEPAASERITRAVVTFAKK